VQISVGTYDCVSTGVAWTEGRRFDSVDAGASGERVEFGAMRLSGLRVMLEISWVYLGLNVSRLMR
jgi:hypothetical protein